MAQYTTNYNLTKIDLTDAPPDITVLNQNWDTIDQMLKTLEESASEAFITAEDLHTIEKTSIVQADSNTLNTPYKDSLTSATNGTCVVSVTGNNKTLFYICNGVTNPVYIQSCINGVWNNWKTIIDDAYVTIDQLENYIPKSEKGAASGVATLDSSGKLTEAQLPDSVGEDIAALGKELHDWWVYASDTMAYTCVTPSDTSTKPYSYTETVKDSGSEVVATLVTTCNADGSYTETLTRGDVTVTRKWTKSGNTYERGVWTKWTT